MKLYRKIENALDSHGPPYTTDSLPLQSFARKSDSVAASNTARSLRFFFLEALRYSKLLMALQISASLKLNTAISFSALSFYEATD